MEKYMNIYIDKTQCVIFINYDSDVLEKRHLETFKEELAEAYNCKVLVIPNTDVQII